MRTRISTSAIRSLCPNRSKDLLSESYAQAQRQRISLDKAATGKVQPGKLAWVNTLPKHAGTTCRSAVRAPYDG